MISGVIDKKYSALGMFKVLGVLYLSNFVGSIIVALLVYYSGIMNYSGGATGAFAINVAYAKANGQRINVIWAPNAEKNYTVSEMGSIVTVIDIYGNTRYQNTENGSLTVTATDSPLYVINSGFDYCVISNGSRVQNLDDISGNVFDVSINATLSSNEVKNYLVICAQYDGNRLLSIKFIPISEADYIQDSLSKSVSVDKCTNTNKIKLFRMKNLSSLIPLSDSLEIN
jgi:hypothetical protein